jgi:flagellar biosynthesis protein FlhB
VVLQASIAPLASHVSNHAEKFAHVTVKELVVVFDYTLQVLDTLLHRFHGLETFVDRCVEILDGLTANSTTHRMQSEGVVVAIISTIIPVVVATTIVVAVAAVAVGAFGSPLLGLLVPNVEVVIFDGIARCDSSGRGTPSATDVGGPLDG